MPRAIVSQVQQQRTVRQQVAAQARDVLGAVEVVAEQATGLQVSIDLIDGSVEGGLTASLGTKLADFDARIAALESP